MARMRTIKPGFFTSEDVSVLPLRARLTWIGLWTHCDDHGRTKELVKLIKAAVWPLDDVSLRDIGEDLELLADAGLVVRYAVDGGRFVAVQNWHFHQKVNRPGDTKIPPPPVPIAVPPPGENGHCPACWVIHERLTEPSLIPHEQLIAGGVKEKVKEGRGNARGATPPPGSRPRCQRHAHLPDDDPGPNCVACRDVRLAAEKQTTAVPAKPDWCGKCDENTRQIERDDGSVGRCRVCHPLRSVS